MTCITIVRVLLCIRWIALYPVNRSATVQSTWRIVRSRSELSTTPSAKFFQAVIAFFSLAIRGATYTFYSYSRRAMMEKS